MLSLKSPSGKIINIHGNVDIVTTTDIDKKCCFIFVNSTKILVAGTVDEVSEKIEALVEFSSKQFICLISPLACVDYLVGCVFEDQYGAECPGTKIVFASGESVKVEGTVKSVERRLNA